MMKRFLIILLTLTLLLCGCGREEPPETTVSADGPEITETIDIPEGQEALTKPPAESPTITITREVRMASLDENGEERWFREYTYDEYGRLSTEREVSGTGQETFFATVTYHDTGEGLEIRYTDAQGRVTTTRETRDGRGNLVRCEYLVDGTVDYFTVYTYDDAGNLTSEETHYSGDPGVPRIEYTYDGQGNRTGHYEYDGEELTGWSETVFDAGGRRTETCFYGFDGELASRTQYTWEGSTEIGSGMDPDGTVYMVILSTYDEDGNLMRQETQQEGCVISCTEYTYESFEIIAP